MNSHLILLALASVVLVAFAQQEPPVPPFLEGAPPATVQEFEKLLASSGGKTDAQIDAAVDAWVAKQSAGIKTKYVAFKNELKSGQAAAEAAHKAALGKFSAAAKEADAKLSAIANNPSLTAEQKGQQIEAILNGLKPEVRKEIETAMQG